MRFTNEEILKNKKKQRWKKKIISTIIYIIIIPIIIYNILYLLQPLLYKNIQLDFLSNKIFAIDSEDMKPTLNKWDLILVKETDEDNIKENDIITFKKDERIITHRVIGILDTGTVKEFVTKGDNSNKKEQFIIKQENIEGKYQEIKISNVGRFILIIQNKFLIIIILIIYVIKCIHNINKKNKSRMRKEKRNRFNVIYKK